MKRRLRLLLVIAGAALLALTLAVAFFGAPRAQALNLVFASEARLRPSHLPATTRALDDWFPDGAVLLAGDSLIAMLPARRVDARAINLGIGGVGVAETRELLRGRASLSRARAIVLLVGTNDVRHRREPDLASLLAVLPAHVPAVVCAIPPIDPGVQRDRALADIARLNERWREAVAARPRTRFVPVAVALADERGALRRELHQGDGLHLNAEGNRRLAALLREALAALPAQ